MFRFESTSGVSRRRKYFTVKSFSSVYFHLRFAYSLGLLKTSTLLKLSSLFNSPLSLSLMSL